MYQSSLLVTTVDLNFDRFLCKILVSVADRLKIRNRPTFSIFFVFFSVAHYFVCELQDKTIFITYDTAALSAVV